MKIDTSSINLKVRNLNYKKSTENPIYIKSGDDYYELLESQIAYIEEKDGFLILTSNEGYNFSISLFCLDDILTRLNKDKFFKISNQLAVNREAIFHLEEYNNYVLVTLNFKNTFPMKIASDKIDTFRQWISA